MQRKVSQKILHLQECDKKIVQAYRKTIAIVIVVGCRPFCVSTGLVGNH